jgi:diguanylate cyclase (GGDEF)-like protein/PAS domain S-box-containing protein
VSSRPLPSADPRLCLERALEERGYYLGALDAADVGVLVVDGEGHVLLHNSVADRSLELTARGLDVVREGSFEVVRADGAPWPTPERPLHRAVALGLPTSAAVMGLRRRRGTHWLQVTATPLWREGDPRPYAALGTFVDITAQREGEQSLRESEAHFRLLAENSTDVITRHAADGTFAYVSPAISEMLGWAPQELVGRAPVELYHPEDRQRVLATYRVLLSDHAQQTLRYRWISRDGRWVWVETVVRPVHGPDGRLHEIQAATRDVTAQVQAEQRLTRQALADPLTGLANRAALTQDIELRLSSTESLTLLFLDLDRFKVVNDSLGHSAGDEILRTVAGRLSGACRDGDIVSRLGGDEFVVVASGLDEEGALRLADRVQHVLTAPVGVSGHELVISASVGIVVAQPGEEEHDAETLLQGADVSMYRAKAKGRARSVVWTEALSGAATERLDLERDLREALGADRLAVHYQPQIELDTGRVVGVEALVRWCHPAGSLLLPAAFLDVADDSGLVVELGRQVLASACAQVAAWRRAGHADLELSVNLSGQELLDPGRPAQIAELLRSAGLPPAALTVEVLESLLLDAEGDVRAALASYVDIGVHLALDDFGTGSSSLLHLRQLPIAEIKVDRSFVSGLGRFHEDEAIVRAVAALADELGLRCVAEGVEEERQRRWLQAHGVRLAQGFLLARPMPAQEVGALLAASGGAERRRPGRAPAE